MASNDNVTGYVASDPKMVTTNSGRQLATFRMMENNRVFDRESGQWKDADPTTYDVAVSQDKLSANVMAGLKKGQRVTVTGTHTVGAYLDRNGQPQVGHRVWAKDVAASMMHTPVQTFEAASPDRGPEQSATRGVQSPESQVDERAFVQTPPDVENQAEVGWH